MQIDWRKGFILLLILSIPLFAQLNKSPFPENKKNPFPPVHILGDKLCDEARALLPIEHLEEKTKCNSWVIWGISATRMDWRVRKAGEYAAKALALAVMGSGNLAIDPEGFDNLRNPASVNPEIETYYGITPMCQPVGIDDVNWMTPDELNDIIAHLSGIFWVGAWWLWNKIIVKPSNSAGEYQDEATITLTLSNLNVFSEGGHHLEAIPLELKKSLH